MKIQGGRLKGKNIEVRKDKTLRPTKAMIREAMFNILLHGKFLFEDDFITDDNPSRVADRRVVELFCGTGALGFEALSRGASHVTFVDANAETLNLARQNARQLGVMEQSAFIRSDSTRLPKAFQPCHLAFVDPPYGQNLAKPALEALRDMGWLAHGCLVVVESAKQEDTLNLDGFRLLSDRKHDRTRISIYQYAA